MNKDAVIFSALIAAYGCASAQSMGYVDADTPSEAVGMMKVSAHNSEVMRVECIARFPEQKNEIDENLSQWKKKEAYVLAKADFYWGQMAKKKPDLTKTLDYATKVVKQKLELAENAPNGAGQEVLAQYCRQHFSDLASGIWRNARTPKAYQFLDKAP